MKATELLDNLGQSVWLDNITRDLLNRGARKRYINELSVTGLASNPSIFDHAIKKSGAYDTAIGNQLRRGKAGEEPLLPMEVIEAKSAAIEKCKVA